jgi:hypothetical protein
MPSCQVCHQRIGRTCVSFGTTVAKSRVDINDILTSEHENEKKRFRLGLLRAILDNEAIVFRVGLRNASVLSRKRMSVGPTRLWSR